MNIDFKKIKEDYPEAYHRFIGYLLGAENNLSQQELEKYLDAIFSLVKDYQDFKETLNFIHYDTIEAFFDKYGIYITIYQNYQFWTYSIKYKYKEYGACDNFAGERINAKELAILKSFEILNEMF